jgi:CDGSH-type Zn-finger protein
MSKAIIADNKPIAVQLEKDKQYDYCSCGRSANQPFCDGSHKGTDFVPTVFTAAKTGEAWLCCCKQTSSAPYCDGSHKQLSDEQVGTESP